MLTTEQFYTALLAAIEAGKAIMDIYKQDFSVEYKEDKSPLTQADRNAHEVIMNELIPMGFPVLSEEGKAIPYAERSKWKEFWLVDPLDGTKEFIKKNGEFTVNIAFVSNGKPIAGIIYAPVLNKLYFANESSGAHLFDLNRLSNIDLSWENILNNSFSLPLTVGKTNYVVAGSVSHLNIETSEYIDKSIAGKSKVDFLQIGSSLKFCALAEGSVDLYPRLGPTMEWDTAAGHAIAELSGCQVNEYPSGHAMVYNKTSLLNPWFVAVRTI